MDNIDPRLIGLAVAVLLNVCIPVFVVFHLRRRFEITWRIILYGALVFLIFQLILRIPLILILQYFVRDWIQASHLNTVIFMLIAAFTAALFEEGGRWIGYRYWIPEERRWQDGVGFGAGHGGFEAIALVGISQVISLITFSILLYADYKSLFPEAAEKLDAAKEAFLQVQWYRYFWSVFERICALIIQISLSLLVLAAIAGKDLRFLIGAVVFHTLVDCSPIVLHFTGSYVLTETYVFGFAIVSVIIIRSLVARLSGDEYP